jgi:thiamine pyrophosphate-dependent acetolactate synthase large subunit-like protein
MEQLFHPSPANELANWTYAKMAELWGGKGYLFKTHEELVKGLKDAKNRKTFSIIGVITDGKP